MKIFAETTAAKAFEHITIESAINIDYYYSEDVSTGEGVSHYEIKLCFEDEKS